MKSFLSWVGGKKLLRSVIAQEFPEKYKRYVEVFGGAGWLLFYEERSAHEVYNDVNKNLVNLFKCVKYHACELQRELDFMMNSRSMFREYISQMNSEGLTDIQRAARFFQIIKTSYGSKCETYGAVRKDMRSATEYLTDVQNRLSKVVVENKSYDEILEKYDSEETLFYLDPPYYKSEKYYHSDFGEEQHKHLSILLHNIEGKFILSYNDEEFIRDLYKDFTIIEVERNNNLNSRYHHKDQRYRELIIKNY